MSEKKSSIKKETVDFVHPASERKRPKRKIGAEPLINRSEEGIKRHVTFLCTDHGLTLYIDDNHDITFKNNQFVTDFDEDIEFIRTHSAFGLDVFEGEYPPDVEAKMKEEKEALQPFSEEAEMKKYMHEMEG